MDIPLNSTHMAVESIDPIGLRMTDLPIRAEKVLKAIKKKKNQEG
jgi:hypothetical protein